MKNTFAILFYLKKSKLNSNNEAPIYLRITVEGKRAEFSIKRKINIKKWNSSGNKAIGRTEETRALNEYINVLTSKVYKIHKDLVEEGNEISSATIKNILTGSTTKTKSIIEIFEYHNNQLKVLEGKQYAPATVKRYDTALKHVKRFINHNFNIDDMPINKVDHKFVTDFEFYMKSKRNCSHNTTLKYIKNFKKIVRLALANSWIDKDPFINYKASFNAVEREFLSKKEIDTIIKKDLHTPRLDLVRDIFIFSVYTSLSYIDVKLLSKNDLVIGIDGEKWIKIKRKKTNTISNVPILPVAEKIINKYKNRPDLLNSGKLLPVLSNQKMNAYLKEITDLCKISKDITFHSARHTFGTTITLLNNVPLESVSKMMGHKSIRTTQHYAKILDSKVSSDMAVLKKKLKDNENRSSDKSAKEAV